MDKPKVYVFSGVKDGGEGACFALAEDGTLLGSHFCTHEGFAKQDLGMVEGIREDRREDYAKHYPDGYTMEFVAAKDYEAHEELNKAMKLNKKRKPVPRSKKQKGV